MQLKSRLCCSVLGCWLTHRISMRRMPLSRTRCRRPGASLRELARPDQQLRVPGRRIRQYASSPQLRRLPVRAGWAITAHCEWEAGHECRLAGAKPTPNFGACSPRRAIDKDGAPLPSGFVMAESVGMPPQTLDSAAHVVQLALTPIFLLAGLAQLLNVFTARLGRIADRAYRLSHEPTASRVELKRLTLRSRILDGAVLMAALSGGLTCGAALTMFLGALRNAGAGVLLFIFFGGALFCAIAALAAFAAETFLSGRGVREKVTDATDALDARQHRH